MFSIVLRKGECDGRWM